VYYNLHVLRFIVIEGIDGAGCETQANASDEGSKTKKT
jgi:thymidylate kinase